MATGIDLFVWHRPDGGFEWQNGTPLENQTPLSEIDRKETRFLVPKPMEVPRHLRYAPLVKYPTLYREFAALKPTEDAYAQFASDYGELGVGVFIESQGFAARDPFCRWRSGHAHIRAVADVLGAIQAGDTATLKQWFTLTKEGARYHRADPITWESMGWVTVQGELREYLWTWAMKADSDAEVLLRIAQGWAQEKINEALEGDKQPGTSSTARVVFDQDRGQMTLRIVPATLIGAMWFQCARVLTLNPTFRACRHCREWFELSPDKRRKQSIYCSDRCKVAAYRAKKAAAQLASTGPSLAPQPAPERRDA